MIINFHAPLKATKIDNNWFVDCVNLFDIISSARQLEYHNDLTYPESIEIDAFWTYISNFSNATDNELFKISMVKRKNGSYNLNKLVNTLNDVLIKTDKGLFLNIDAAIVVVSRLTTNLGFELSCCISELTKSNNAFDITEATITPIIEIDVSDFEKRMNLELSKDDWLDYFDSNTNSAYCYFD